MPDHDVGNTILVNGSALTLYSYTPQTNYTLISQAEWDAKAKDKKRFKNNITLFGVVIFCLYAYTQRKRWKNKLSGWTTL
ncbi:MAG: hypothetical protein LC650_04775 [Actinobacteria bacterium]|nr:hypothetical protein [Actinomycetota bacterium]